MIDPTVWSSMYLLSGMPIVLGLVMIAIGPYIAATPAVSTLPYRDREDSRY